MVSAERNSLAPNPRPRSDGATQSHCTSRYSAQTSADPFTAILAQEIADWLIIHRADHRHGEGGDIVFDESTQIVRRKRLENKFWLTQHGRWPSRFKVQASARLSTTTMQRPGKQGGGGRGAGAGQSG